MNLILLGFFTLLIWGQLGWLYFLYRNAKAHDRPFELTRSEKIGIGIMLFLALFNTVLFMPFLIIIGEY